MPKLWWTIWKERKYGMHKFLRAGLNLVIKYNPISLLFFQCCLAIVDNIEAI